MTEKENLEKAACEQFLKAYNQTYGCSFKTELHSDKPDFIVKDTINGQSIGIEIAHLFHDQQEAKLLLGRDNGLHDSIAISDDITSLNELINQKCNKALNYDYGGSLHLVIRIASPIWDKANFEKEVENIVIPACKYVCVWLIFRVNPEQLMKLK